MRVIKKVSWDTVLKLPAVLCNTDIMSKFESQAIYGY